MKSLGRRLKSSSTAFPRHQKKKGLGTNSNKQTAVAKLDAHLTGDQEVAGLTPAGSATFFCGDIMKKF